MYRLAFLSLLLLVPAIATAQVEPEPLNVYHGEIPVGARTFYLAPDGNDDNPGSEDEPWQRIHYAVMQLQPGDVLVARGGVYEVPAPVTLGSNGTDSQRIVISAYPGEVPIFDFSSMTRARNNHGFRLNGDWWHLIGFTIRYAAHNGIRIDGNHNILEQITAYENVDTGIHMAGGASYNLVLNSDSFRNFDPPEGGNADGFSAKFEVGPGNVFRGCRAWNNSDDGWDFWEAHSVVVIENSWAFGNGDGEALGAGPLFNGNGNGFKLGGGSNAATRPNVGHIVRRSLAFDNIGPSGNSKGFDNNNNFGGFRLEHNTAFNNGRNFVFPYIVPGQQAVFVNNLAFDPVTSTNVQMPPENVVFAGNSWQDAIEITPDMFASVDTDLARAPRNADGSLPEIDLLRPTPLSYVVDRGVFAGVEYYCSAPDMGAFELPEGRAFAAWSSVGSGSLLSDVKTYDWASADDWSLQDTFEPGTAPYGDAVYAVADVAQGVFVHEWIRPAQAASARNHFRNVVEFSVTEEMAIMVAHSVDIEPKPSWLDAFHPISYEITLAGPLGNEHAMQVFWRHASPGDTLVLGRNSLDGADAPMYLVLAGELFLISTEDEIERPDAVTLHPIYPNPARHRATVSFSAPRSETVRLQLFDVTGRRVRNIFEGTIASGPHQADLDLSSLSAGVYFVRLNAGSSTSVQRVIVAP